ncbi:MAG: TIGR00296 family protein [Methanocalculaceae archaeon]|jgi:uncharacterized protein (TIGR00296 family)|nr:TIGR00296 family protein [Methanocalculaceae archaeon]
MNLLTDTDGQFALARARALTEVAVQQKPAAEIIYPPEFAVPRGVFVTLTKFGVLRGCMGVPYPVMLLSEALEDAAVSAAVRDPRFRPVSPTELPNISLEVTVLTQPEALICQPAKRPEHVKVGHHGLIAKAGSHSGLLLPQVAAEYGWTPTEFLNQTCSKAGISPSAWRENSCSIFLFEGQIFAEKKRRKR